MDSSNVVKAVVFDMDGLLLDTERLAKTAWMDAAAHHGHPLDETIYSGMIGRSGDGARHHLRQHGWSGDAIARVEATAWKAYVESLDRGEVACKTGVFELLDYLDANGIPPAVATSTRTALAERSLERVGLRHRFRMIVGGDQVSQGKPAPDIYLRTATTLACAPDACVALEDSGPGLRAASAAGMRVIWVPDLCHVDDATQRLACAVVPTLVAAIAAIDTLLRNSEDRASSTRLRV